MEIHDRFSKIFKRPESTLTISAETVIARIELQLWKRNPIPQKPLHYRMDAPSTLISDWGSITMLKELGK